MIDFFVCQKHAMYNDLKPIPVIVWNMETWCLPPWFIINIWSPNNTHSSLLKCQFSWLYDVSPMFQTTERQPQIIEPISTEEPFAADDAHETHCDSISDGTSKKNKRKNKKKRRKKRNLLASLWDSVCRQFGVMRNPPAV